MEQKEKEEEGWCRGVALYWHSGEAQLKFDLTDG
jgi:hypothetical protein